MTAEEIEQEYLQEKGYGYMNPAIRNEFSYWLMELFLKNHKQQSKAKPLPSDEHKKITGFDTPQESTAYDKGREDEQEVMMMMIQKWNGSDNSVLGQLLKSKLSNFSQPLEQSGEVESRSVNDYTKEKKLLVECLSQYNDENENVSDTLFTIYPTEMNAIVRLLKKCSSSTLSNKSPEPKQSPTEKPIAKEAEGSKWISVNDELPKNKTGDYLVLRKEGAGVERWIFKDDRGYWYNYFEITHWQPLPTPPTD